MKRLSIVILTLFLSFLLVGCSISNYDTETGILTGNPKEVFIGSGSSVRSILENNSIKTAFKYQNDLIISYDNPSSSDAHIKRFHRGIEVWSFDSKSPLKIVEQLDNLLILTFPSKDGTGTSYAQLNLNTGKSSIIIDSISFSTSINNHQILVKISETDQIIDLYLLTGNQITKLTTSSSYYFTVKPINDTTFYITELLENNQYKVTVYDVDGSTYGSYEFEDINNVVQYDTYFYYLDFLSLTIYDFNFEIITEHEFEYRVGTTISLEGFDNDGLIVEVDRFVSSSLRKIKYNGEIITDYRGNSYNLQYQYSSYTITDLYGFENGDLLQLNYEPAQLPSGILKRVSSSGDIVWSIDIESTFIKYLLFDDFIRVLTPSVIHDYSFDGKLIKIINTKCDYPVNLFEISYTCVSDRLYVYSYENDQIFEKKYLTNPEYFHSSYDYYIVSDYRLNESLNLSYHYYNLYQNDGDVISRVNMPFIDQYNINGKTYVLVANISGDNIILDEYTLYEYNEFGEIVNEYITYQTDYGIIYMNGPTVVLLERL